MVKVNKNAVEQELEKIVLFCNKEDRFLKKPYGRVALHFRAVLKHHNYIISKTKWIQSLREIDKIFLNPDYSHITVDDWIACIDWAFSPERYKSSFWKKVKVTTFTTVFKMYNDFNAFRCSKEEATTIEKENIEYGRL